MKKITKKHEKYLEFNKMIVKKYAENQRICPICLENFIRIRKNQIYCSYQCRNFRKNHKGVQNESIT